MRSAHAEVSELLQWWRDTITEFSELITQILGSNPWSTRSGRLDISHDPVTCGALFRSGLSSPLARVAVSRTQGRAEPQFRAAQFRPRGGSPGPSALRTPRSERSQGWPTDGEPLFAVVQDTFGEYLAARWVIENASDDEDLARQVAEMMAVGRFDVGWRYVVDLAERRGCSRSHVMDRLRLAAESNPDAVDRSRVTAMLG